MPENSGNYRLLKLNQWDQVEVDVFLPTPPKHSQRPGHCMEDKHQETERWNAREALPETWRPRAQHSGELVLWISFVWYIWAGCWRSRQLRSSNGTEEKPALSTQRTRKEAA